MLMIPCYIENSMKTAPGNHLSTGTRVALPHRVAPRIPDCDRRYVMRRSRSIILILTLIFTAAGCAGARLTEMIQTPYSGPLVQSIAIDPRGGIMGEEIAMHLVSGSLKVFDSDQTIQIARRAGIDEYHINSPEGLEGLRNGGVDALLIVKTMIGWDGKPQIVTARLINTHTSEVITGFSWENGWGGDFGSIADRTMRKSVPEAARQISASILNRIR